MDDLGKRPDFKLSVQGSTFRNYGTPSKYMSVNRLPKHTDSPSLLQIDHKSGIYVVLAVIEKFIKSSSSLWNSSTSSLTGNVSDRLNNVSTRFSKLELNENPEPNKKLCNGYYTDYCSIENIQSEVQRESSEIGKSINSRIYTRWSNSSPIHTTASSLVGSHLSYHRGGLVGLNNLGKHYPMLKLDKTDKLCFMNSILQCLSNTAPLTEYCLEDRYLKDINKSSSMNGMLFRSYADLMKEIWDPDMANSSTSPSRFKSQIQRFAPRFMGYSQQDSQEFLRYVLEGLHMEVNRVQKRPIPTKPDYEAEDRLP
ncbi:Ubiquitin carboxyl-terminal hydrolase 2 [Schistosoma japonicum]|nr:Ubiquitin carboxyl-terminal hydrolase 2 [Schistosoma japonicum]KAH8849369.1 Ubiquitin carboxyl-terminal hydrolase 2 [Schistosoma japonicum]